MFFKEITPYFTNYLWVQPNNQLFEIKANVQVILVYHLWLGHFIRQWAYIYQLIRLYGVGTVLTRTITQKMHERQCLKEQTALSFKMINATIKPPRPRIKTMENFRPESIPIYIWFSDEIFSDAIRVFHKLRTFVFSFYICTTSHVMYFMLGEMLPLRHPSNKWGINVETIYSIHHLASHVKSLCMEPLCIGWIALHVGWNSLHWA